MAFQSRRSRRINTSQVHVEPIAELWILRILVKLEAYRQLITDHFFENEALAKYLGLTKTEDQDVVVYDPAQCRRSLSKRHREAEAQSDRIGLPSILEKNIQQLAKHIGLSEIECWILGFSVMMRNQRWLDEVADWLGDDLTSLKLFHILSEVLDFPEQDVRQALNSTSVLSKTGLVVLDRNHRNSLGRKLDLLSNSFGDRLIAESGSPLDWLKDMIRQSPYPELTIKNYEHLEDTLTCLIPYLRHVNSSKRKGVNLLVHGAPGTGKTQLVRTLAVELACPLYEITCEDEDGDPMVGEQRLRTYGVAQQFLHNSTAFVLFDEAEDVFMGGHFLSERQSPAQRRKAWMNRLLEDNACPTFWLTNSIEAIDPAFIRRFDWIISVPVPPKSQREQFIRKKCGQLLDEKSIKKLANYETLAPAVVDRLGNVISCIRDELPAEKLSNTLTGMIQNTLLAQGHRNISMKDKVELPEFYDPQLLNCDVDIPQMVSGIKDTAARICLYGPPGTGKTAYSHWLAEQLGKPLHVKRASDLFSKWVGDTEKNIARIFQDAEDEQAVLLIDEVDSFLMDRQAGRNAWEITGVNEMLSRMEDFGGVFIASTNRLESLDAAALRRFDLKVKFSVLSPEQAWKLFQAICQTLGIAGPSNSLRQQLDKIDNITPGDFALLARQHRFYPFKEAAVLLNKLQTECALKDPYQKQPIGFVA